MKTFILFLSFLCFGTAAFAQANTTFERIAPPQNAKSIVKSMDNATAPAEEQGQPIQLDQSQSASAQPIRNEDLPPEKRKRVRKGFDVKSGQVLYREVVTLEELDARAKKSRAREEKANTPTIKE